MQNYTPKRHEPLANTHTIYSSATASASASDAGSAAGGVVLLGEDAFGAPPAGLGTADAFGLAAAGAAAAGAAAEWPWPCQTSGPGMTYLLLEATAASCIEYLNAVSDYSQQMDI
jgi:hypothetical protein